MNATVRKQYVVFEISQPGIGFGRTPYHIESTLPKSAPFDIREEAEDWIMANADANRPNTFYTILEVYTTA